MGKCHTRVLLTAHVKGSFDADSGRRTNEALGNICSRIASTKFPLRRPNVGRQTNTNVALVTAAAQGKDEFSEGDILNLI